MTCSKHVENYK